MFPRWVVKSHQRKSVRFSWSYLFLISNLCRVLKVVRFLLGNSIASEFFIPTLLWRWDRVFRNIGIYNSDAGELPRRKHTTKWSYLIVVLLILVSELWYTRWFKYDRDCLHLFTHKSVPVIFEPPCIIDSGLDDPSLIPDWHVGIFLCTVISMVFLATHWFRDHEFSKLNLRVPHTLACPVVMLEITFFAFCADLDS